MGKKPRQKPRQWKRERQAARAKTNRIINGSQLTQPEEIQRRAMAHHGVDRMMVVENGVVTFIERNRK